MAEHNVPVLIVTGTSTEIGKTIVTAAISAALTAQGQRVHVVKLAQTGLQPGEPGDVDVVRQLAGDSVAVSERLRLPDPLAPDVAAVRAGASLPTMGEHAAYVAELARSGDADVVLVEGSGGLLVHLDAVGGTIADLGKALQELGIRAGYVVVAAAGLGTLNHTALTLEALRNRSLDLIGVVIGAMPATPDLASATNVAQLRDLAGGQLLGQLPEGAGSLSPVEFQRDSQNWITL